MLQCDQCGNSIVVEGFIIVTVCIGETRETLIACSPDCLVDYTAKIYTQMRART